MTIYDPDRLGEPTTFTLWVRRAFWVVLAFLCLPLVLICAGALSLLSITDKIVAVELSRVAEGVAETLLRLGVKEPPPPPGPDYDRVHLDLMGQIKPIDGYRESGGMQGDGSDGYLVEFTPELAQKVREALPKSTVAKKYQYFPPDGPAPEWWPKKWPKDAQCFVDGSVYIVVPKEGNRFWFYTIRM